ncbi:hypothetical protein [Microcoleus sp. S13_C5]|uniref:hypothetical protein n=1 Tax=Microcoleus sp. S13_C5 TaxID=3055411 RepID=UPI002FD68F64
MVKIRCGEDLGIDTDLIIGWVLVKDCCKDYQYSSLNNPIEKARLEVEDRLILYTSADNLVLTSSILGHEVFTRIHNFLVHLFECDFSEDGYIKVTTAYSQELPHESALDAVSGQ